MNNPKLIICLAAMLMTAEITNAQVDEKQLANLLKRFPQADANKDGKLTISEAMAFQQKMRGKGNQRSRGVQRNFNVDPGWDKNKFPEHAACYKSPEELADLFEKVKSGREQTTVSYPKPQDGSLRIVGTGHSFMQPGYKVFGAIARTAGFKQPPLVTHTGGGMTGSTRYKWEQENGIFQFDGKPRPKLLASISNAEWDVMMWGPYFNDRAAYYKCWIEFALKYNPDMKFYLSDAWPQLYQLEKNPPKSESELTPAVLAKMAEEKTTTYGPMVDELNDKYDNRIFVMPTSDAMVIAAEYLDRGELPGVQGVHKVLGKKERSLWRDYLGHLGPGFGNLEGYVFYATVYGRSPELIDGDVDFGDIGDYPSRELDRIFRTIAWKAVLNNPRSGVADKNGNKIADDRESP